MSAARARVLILALPAAAGTVHAADAPPATTTTPGVVVTGQRSEDYRVESLDSLGPLGTTPLLDTPYTVSVLPAEDAMPDLAWNVAVGLRRPDDAMREAIDAALDRLSDDGTIAQIYGRYGVSVQRPR